MEIEWKLELQDCMQKVALTSHHMTMMCCVCVTGTMTAFRYFDCCCYAKYKLFLLSVYLEILFPLNMEIH